MCVVLFVVVVGCFGGVSIATNMAGRGTDIVLGGSLESVFAVLGVLPVLAVVVCAFVVWLCCHERVLASGG